MLHYKKINILIKQVRGLISQYEAQLHSEGSSLAIEIQLSSLKAHLEDLYSQIPKKVPFIKHIDKSEQIRLNKRKNKAQSIGSNTGISRNYQRKIA